MCSIMFVFILCVNWIPEKVENLGIERLVDESVVKIERRTAQQNKLKPHKIPKYEAHVSSSGARNLAAGRLTKLKKDLQETIVGGLFTNSH